MRFRAVLYRRESGTSSIAMDGKSRKLGLHHAQHDDDRIARVLRRSTVAFGPSPGTRL